MSRIQQVSYIFRVFFQITFVAILVGFLISWIYAPETFSLFGGAIQLSAIPHSYTSSGPNGDAILHTLSASEKGLGLLDGLLPLSVELFIVYFLIKLFGLYEKGEIFSINNVRYIRNIAYFLLIGQLIHPIYETLMGFVLTWHNPPGHRFAAVSVDQSDLGIILTALLVILISWIMAEACKLREEQRLTV